VSGEFSTKPVPWRAALGWAAVAVAVFAPVRSRYVYHWDAGEFAMAVREFNVALSQPHAPGYPLYVALGKLANVVVGEPHAALVWVSVLAGAWLVAVMFGAGTEMFGRRAGVAAAVLALTCPQVWFHSGVAFSYAVDAAAVTTLVWLAWRAAQRGLRTPNKAEASVVGAPFWARPAGFSENVAGGSPLPQEVLFGGLSWRAAVGLGLGLAVVGGIRPQTVPPLTILVSYAAWQAGRQRFGKWVLTGVVAAAGAVVWLVPTIESAGGWAAFWDIVQRHARNNAPVTFSGGGWPAVADNVVAVGAYCWNGLLLAVVPLAVAMLRRDNSVARRWVAWWVTPFLVAGTMVGFTSQPGYVLSYLPGMLLLAASALRRVWQIGLVAAVNVLVFLAWPVGWEGALFGVGRTWREIREHDAMMERTLAALRAQCDPRETIVYHAAGWFALGLRHVQVHAPEYEQYQFGRDPTVPTPVGREYWSVREGRLEFVAEVPLPVGKQWVMVVPPGMGREIFRGRLAWETAVEVPGSGGVLRRASVQELDSTAPHMYEVAPKNRSTAPKN